MRWIAGVLIAALFAQGCSSAQKVEKSAFLAAGLALQREAPEPTFEECREFLDRGGQELSDWGRLHLVPSTGTVPRPLWLDYVDRVAAIRAHESCLRIR